MTYDAVLFDMDGVLLEGFHTPRRFYHQATERLLGAYELEAVENGFRDPDDADEWLAACERHDLPADDLWERREAMVCELENEHIADGGRVPYDDADVLDALAVPTGVVSNNRHETVTFAVQHAGWDVDVVHGRDPTLAGYDRLKPDPHYLERALDDLDVAGSDALYVGDRETDVRAANAVDADAALLARDDVQDESGDPDYVLDSLYDLRSLL